jgi:hypothetical protein
MDNWQIPEKCVAKIFTFFEKKFNWLFLLAFQHKENYKLCETPRYLYASAVRNFKRAETNF